MNGLIDLYGPLDRDPLKTFQDSLSAGLRNQQNAQRLQSMQMGNEQQAQLMPLEIENQRIKQDQLAQQLIDKDAGRTAFMLSQALERGDFEGAKAVLSQNADDIDALGDPSFKVQQAIALVDQDPDTLQKMSQGIMQLTGFSGGS